MDGPLTIDEVFDAYFDCRKHKRNTVNQLRFEADLEGNLVSLYRDLYEGRYRIGRCIAFVVTHPKIREICAADFRDAGSFYSTLGHEQVHATRHEKCLNRDFGQKRFGDHAYAMEELTAEIGAAFLCADLELEPQIRDDHAPYVASWLKALKDDKRAIFTAASHAQRAVDFLHGLQPATAEPATITDPAPAQAEQAA